MTAKAKSLLMSALALPEEERMEIADGLLASLSEANGADVDEEAFIQELRRRSEEAEKDPDATIPWSELKKLT